MPTLMPVSQSDGNGHDQNPEEEAEAGGQAPKEDRDVGERGQDRDGGDEDEEEARCPRGARDPGQPTSQEREEHERTHTPFRPWCVACIRGKSKRKPSRRLAGEYSQSQCCRVRMDYACLTEDVATESGEHSQEESEKAEATLTMLVMQESQHRSVWAYAIEPKGTAEDWLPIHILEDLETIGVKEEKIVLKSDQEAAIVDLTREIAKLRESSHGASIENSAVGESDSNASVERAIQDVEGQVRTLRAGLEMKLGQRIRLTNPVVPWMIRHAAALITRCRVRPAGMTSLESIKGHRTHSQIRVWRAHYVQDTEDQTQPRKV